MLSQPTTGTTPNGEQPSDEEPDDDDTYLGEPLSFDHGISVQKNGDYLCSRVRWPNR